MDVLEQYWQKGGTYVIPVEIINQINGEFEEKDKEIERLHSIIKEVREYMNKNEIEEVYLDCKLYETKVYKDILEILDKVEKENDIEFDVLKALNTDLDDDVEMG